MERIKKMDTVIVSNTHHNKLFAGRIGFVIEVRNDNPEREMRYDIQFPFDVEIQNTGLMGNVVFQQGQYGANDITVLQRY